MPQYTAVVHTRITVTAPDAKAAAQALRDLTDRAAEQMESGPAGVIVQRSTITALTPTDDNAIWGDLLEPCAECDEATTHSGHHGSDRPMTDTTTAEITTAAELDALPTHTTVTDNHGTQWKKFWGRHGDTWSFRCLGGYNHDKQSSAWLAQNAPLTVVTESGR